MVTSTDMLRTHVRSVVFMAGATLLFRSARNSAALDLGFDPDSVVVASLNLTELGYDRAHAGTFFGEVLPRVRAMPGIQHAALADFAPDDFAVDALVDLVVG